MRLERESIRFSLRPVPPYRLDWTVWALRRRATNAVDQWDGSTYQRGIIVDGKAAQIAVTQHQGILELVVTGMHLPASTRQSATNTIERLLGISVNLSGFYEFSQAHPCLNQLALRFRGMKPPRFATVFEALVNGITCQQLSLTVGIILLNRLARRCGVIINSDSYAFPRPEDLTRIEPASLRELGYSGNKTRALIGLATSVATGRLNLEDLEQLDNAECVERLVAIKGVGRWTAEYVLLRGLGRIDIFPGDDVGARNSLVRWLHLRNKLDYQQTGYVLSKWRDYGGLIFFHLLLEGLSEAGLFGHAGDEHLLPASA